MTFSEFAESAFRQVLAATILGSVLFPLVWGIQRLFSRRLGPAWRHALWLIVLFRLLVPVLPETPFSLFNAPRWFRSSEPAPVVKVTFIDEDPAHSAPSAMNAVPVPSATQSLPAAPLNWFQILAFVWFAIASALLFRLLIGSCWLRLRLRKGTTLDPLLIHALSEARSWIRTWRNPRLVETAAVNSPGLFGCFRPQLLVPLGIGQQLAPPELRHIFLHELAHLKRGDLWTNCVMSLVLSLHWFNPLAWFMARRLRLERELACDALVLRLTAPDDQSSYGRTILKLLERLPVRPALPAVVGILEEKQAARSRLTQIAQFSSSRAPSRFFGGMAVLFLVLTGLSNAQLDPAPGEPPPGPVVRQTSAGRSDIEALREEYEKQKIEVQKAQKNVDELRTQLKVTESDSGPNETVRALDRDRTAAESRALQLQKLADQLKGKSRAELRKVIPSVSPDLAMDRYLGDLAKVEQQYAANINELSADHPEITKLKSLMKTINQQIEDRIDGVLLGLDLQIAQNKVLVRELGNRLEAARKQEIDRNEQHQPYFHAKRNLENQQHILDTLERRIATEKVDARAASGPVPASTLVQDGRLLMEMGKLSEAEAKFDNARQQDPEHRAARYYLDLVKKQRSPSHVVVTSSNVLTYLDRIVLPHWKANMGTPVSEALAHLEKVVIEHDPQQVGIKFALLPPWQGAVLARDIELWHAPLNKVVQRLVDATEIKSDATKRALPAEQNPSLPDVKKADRQPLHTRTFRLNPNVLKENLLKITGKTYDTQESLIEALRNLFIDAGVVFPDKRLAFAESPDMPKPPPGKAVFFNERTGVLMARATLADLNAIERVIQKLSVTPPQVSIETRVLQFEPGAAYEEELLLRAIATNRTTSPMTVTQVLSDPAFGRVIDALEGNKSREHSAEPDSPVASGTRTGVMSERQARELFARLREIKGVNLLGAPKVTTLSNRRARISIEPGPTVDILPVVQPDGVTLRLTTEIDVPPDAQRKIPALRANADGTLSDCETFVLVPEHTETGTVVVLVTPTIIDAAGNRVHPPKEEN